MESGCVKDSLLADRLELVAICVHAMPYMKIPDFWGDGRVFTHLLLGTQQDSCRAHFSIFSFLETMTVVLWFNYYASVVSSLFTHVLCTVYM